MVSDRGAMVGALGGDMGQHPLGQLNLVSLVAWLFSAHLIKDGAASTMTV